MDLSFGVRVALVTTALVFTVPALTNETTPARAGTIPQGIWELNQERSNSLHTGRQTLWIVKDDGRSFVWASIVIHEGEVQILSSNGVYGGQWSKVDGAPIEVQTISTGPDKLRNSGTIAGRGRFVENCVVFPDRKRLRCEGELHSDGQKSTYVDDFDWFSESPPAARL